MLELQDRVSGLQTLNNELQSRLSLLEKSDQDAYNMEDQDLASSRPWKQVRDYKRQLQMKEVDLEVVASMFLF